MEPAHRLCLGVAAVAAWATRVSMCRAAAREVEMCSRLISRGHGEVKSSDLGRLGRKARNTEVTTYGCWGSWLRFETPKLKSELPLQHLLPSKAPPLLLFVVQPTFVQTASVSRAAILHELKRGAYNSRH